MSGGTNPDHPWRMPDYAFYQELLQYAGSAGWVRPGQGDWHARLEEYEWCRDGRWVKRVFFWPTFRETLVKLWSRCG
jgi:hypothetical protein